MLTETKNKFRNILRDILDSQMKLNNRTNGKDWLLGFTDKEKPIFWLLCLKQELSEAIDCFNWKHWKYDNKEFEFNKFIMEIMDVIHFGVSQIQFTMYWTIITAAKEQYELLSAENSVAPAELDELYNKYGFLKAFEDKFKKFEKLTGDEVQQLTNDIILFYFDSIDTDGVIATLNSNTEKLNASFTYNGVVNKEAVLVEQLSHMLIYYTDEQAFIVRLLTLLGTIKEHYEFDETNIHKYYIVKNVLNIFRQDHGFNNGSYVKDWDGELEDNDVAVKLFNNIAAEEFSIDKFYAELEKFYTSEVLKPLPDYSGLIK